MSSRPVPAADARSPFAARRPRIHFLTLVTWQAQPLLGDLRLGHLVLSPLGRLVDDEWRRSPALRPYLTLGAWVVMPNHLHALIEWTDPAAAARPGASIASFLKGFKAACTSRANVRRRVPCDTPLWATGWYDRVVEDERRLATVRRYIEEAPARWRRG